MALDDIIAEYLSFIKGMSNWYVWFLIRVGLYRNGKNVVYVLRDKTRFEARQTLGDGWAIWVAFLQKIYTPENFEITRNDVVVDIGAYIGTFTVFAGQKAAKVYSFEPIPQNFKLAKSNIEKNNLTNVSLQPFGVAKTEGTRTFFIPVGYWDSCNLFNSSGKVPVNIKCTTLNDIVRQNGLKKIDFLKIDCEGAEYEILFNTDDAVFSKINKIVLEYHSIGNYTIADLKPFLEQKGFVVTIEPKFDTLYARKSGDLQL